VRSSRALAKPGKGRRRACRSIRPRSRLIVCASGGKRGEHNQAIGRSRGGRTTKIHALSDPLVPASRHSLDPWASRADIAAAPDVLGARPPGHARPSSATKAMTATGLRAELVKRGATAGLFPTNPTRVVIQSLRQAGPTRDENVIERCFFWPPQGLSSHR